MKIIKVGIAVPCHEDDLPLFRYCRHSLRNLDPQPYRVAIDVNEGKQGLMEIRRNLFDGLFDNGCDVALQCSADFYLFPRILRYVLRSEVVAFTPLFRSLLDLNCAFHIVLLRGRAWSGCYSIPKELWFDVARDKFDGTDTSISRAVKKWKVKAFQYKPLRPYGKEHTQQLLASFPLWKRLVWQFVRMKAVRLRS